MGASESKPAESQENSAAAEEQLLDIQNPDHGKSTCTLTAPLEEEEEKHEDGSQNHQEKEGKEGSEEEGECGFCLFMKAGECRDSFIEWENSCSNPKIDGFFDQNPEYSDECVELWTALNECMQAHADYYGPLLNLQKAAGKDAVEGFDQKKDAVSSMAVEPTPQKPKPRAS